MLILVTILLRDSLPIPDHRRAVAERRQGRGSWRARSAAWARRRLSGRAAPQTSACRRPRPSSAVLFMVTGHRAGHHARQPRRDVGESVIERAGEAVGEAVPKRRRACPRWATQPIDLPPAPGQSGQVEYSTPEVVTTPAGGEAPRRNRPRSSSRESFKRIIVRRMRHQCGGGGTGRRASLRC